MRGPGAVSDRHHGRTLQSTRDFDSVATPSLGFPDLNGQAEHRQF